MTVASPLTPDEAGRSTIELQPSSGTTPSAKEFVRQLVRRRLFGGPTSSIGRYTLIGHLGSGGMGTVFRAHDDALGRAVAIKVLRAHGPARDTALLREARAMAALSHPNIVEVFEVGTAACGLFIAMEVVHGVPASSWVERSSGLQSVLGVMEQAGRALAYAHAHGVAHGDFKPAHVLVRDDGRVTVLDFGLARWLADGLDHEYAAAGTPAFMAPERLEGGPPTPAADQFAFCAALFELLFGYHPFGEGRARTVQAAIARGVLRVPPRWRVAPRVRRAILRGLQSDPAHRFSGMDELLRALQPRSRALQTIGLASLVAAGSLSVGLAGTRPASTPSCVDRADEIDSRWASTRNEIEAAFEPAQESSADDSWNRVDRLGSNYAQALAAAEAAACADDVHGDARRLCLARLRSGFEEACSLLSEGDADTLFHAVDILQGLDPTDSCVDAGSQTEDSTADPARLQNLREQLAEVSVLKNAGRDREALEAARVVLAEARRLGDGRLLAEAEVRIGSALSALGDDEPALEHFERAYFYAQAHDDSGVWATKAATHLAAGLGSSLFRKEEAERWAERAHAWLVRTDRTGTVEHAELLRTYGELYRAHSDFDSALAYYREAEALLAGQPEHHRIGVLYGIGASLAASGNRREGLQALLESRRISGEHYGQNHPTTARPKVAIGLALSMMGEQDDAREHLEEALADLESAHGTVHPSLADVLSKLAIVASRTGRTEDTIRYQERAIEIHRANANPVAVAELQINLVRFYADAKRLEPAIAVGLEAVTTLEGAVGPWDPMVAQTLEAVGMVYDRTGDLARAAEYVDRALAIYEHSLGSDHPTFGYALGARARIAFRQERYGEALELTQRAHAIFVDRLGPTHVRTRHSYYDLALLLEKEHRYEELVVVRSEALSVRRKLPDVTDADLGGLVVDLAHAQLQLGDPKAAARHATDALRLLEHPDSDPDDMAKARYVLADLLWSSERAKARSLARKLARYYRSEPFDGDPDFRETALAWLSTRGL